MLHSLGPCKCSRSDDIFKSCPTGLLCINQKPQDCEESLSWNYEPQECAVGRGVAISDPFLSSTIYSLCGLWDMSKLIFGLYLKFPLQVLWAEPFCTLFILWVCSCYMHSPSCIFVILTFKFLLGSYSICVI